MTRWHCWWVLGLGLWEALLQHKAQGSLRAQEDQPLTQTLACRFLGSALRAGPDVPDNWFCPVKPPGWMLLTFPSSSYHLGGGSSPLRGWLPVGCRVVCRLRAGVPRGGWGHGRGLGAGAGPGRGVVDTQPHQPVLSPALASSFATSPSRCTSTVPSRR